MGFHLLVSAEIPPPSQLFNIILCLLKYSRWVRSVAVIYQRLLLCILQELGKGVFTGANLTNESRN